MSLILTGGVAVAYAAGVVGIHRFTVYRRRALAQGYPTLRWLDWDTLLGGVMAPPEAPTGEGPTPIEGGPPPKLLQRTDRTREIDLLSALVSGASVQGEAFAEASFSGGEARWLSMLSDVRGEPARVIAQLEGVTPNTVAEAYLHEWLALEHLATPFNLELLTFGAKRRINRSLARFGEHPALYFVRARASSLLGFSSSVLDDLARAVYFSRESPFYLQAVVNMPFVEDARPALVRACREVLQRPTPSAG